MEIIIGKTAGFCAGVMNAVTKAEKELQHIKNNEEIYCLGEIVHNKQVIKKLEEKGLQTVESIEQAKEKAIIRAHGIPKETYEKAEQLNIKLIDLTCPKVLKIHNQVEEHSKQGYYIILIGVEGHPESIGTISFCGKNSYLLTNEDKIPEMIKTIENSKVKKVIIVAQTTYNLKKFEQMAKEIEEKLKDKYKIIIQNTICTATRIRQEETEKISKEVECMIIIRRKK